MWKKTAQNLIISLLLALAMPSVAFAVCSAGQQSCTSTYAVGEAFFGSGGELNSCGTTYCAKQSAGELGVGKTSSTNYTAQAGFNTDRQPYLEFVVNTSSINLGVVTPGTAKTGTATFSVKTYLASGYVVRNASTPPTYSSYTISAPSSPTAFNSTTEMFGINLVANNSCSGSPGNGIPTNLGLDPVQVPSSTYSFGAAATGYDTACQFKYADGDVIASSTKSSGETDFTISYLLNIKGTTPAGTYRMNHVIVATSTF